MSKPDKHVREQADRIAETLKRAERGEMIADNMGRKIAISPTRSSVKFAVAMDDKSLIIEMPLAMIKDMSEHAISEYLLKHMRATRDTVH